MKGLLLKDLFALRKQGRVNLVFALFYLILGITLQNITMFGTLIVLLSAMLPITTLSFDEFHKWDRYALAMPVSRKSIVVSKYILGAIFSFAAAIVVSLANIVIMLLVRETDMVLSFITTLGFVLAANLFLSLVLPILFKFGVEKGRMLMVMVFAAPTLFIMLLSKLGFQLPSDEMLTTLAYFSPLVVIAVMFLSIRISIGIYKTKEF